MSPSASETTVKDNEGHTPKPGSAPKRALTWLNGVVEPKSCHINSVYACFLTGFTSAIGFTACYIWCGFQTGNVTQLGIAIARNFDPYAQRTYVFEKPDQQAMCSLLAFILGTMLGRIGDKMGPKKRSWLVIASILQCLMVMAAALAAHFANESPYALDRAHPSWATPTGMTALGFISASLGLQGVMGKRLGTPMNTTVVVTTTWVEIFNDPLLLSFKHVPGRDIRIAGVFFLFFGGFVGRALIGPCGNAGTLGVLAALRVIQTIWYAYTPGPAAQSPME